MRIGCDLHFDNLGARAAIGTRPGFVTWITKFANSPKLAGYCEDAQEAMATVCAAHNP